MSRNEIWPALVLAIATMLPIWVACKVHHPIDDMYITIAYAKNLAAGNGFVYNGGAPTLGTTTPLTALCLAASKVLFSGVELPRLAIWFSALCWVANGWAIFLFRRALMLGPWEAVLVAGSVFAINHTYLGGEYALFALLLLGSVIAFAGAHWLTCGALIGLLFMTRGEGGLMLPIVGLAVGWQWLRGPRAELGTFWFPVACLGMGFATTAGTWCLWAWQTFGSPLPHTLHVKMLQARLSPDTLGGLFQETLFRNMRGEWGVAAFQYYTPLRALLWLLAFAGLMHAIRRRPLWLLPLAWTAVYLLTYIALRVPGYSFWYTLPALWAWHYLIGLGLCAVATFLSAQRDMRWRIPALGLLTVVLVSLLGGRLLSAYRQAEDPRAPHYIALSRWIERHAQPTDTLMAYDAGFFGYYSQRPLFDLAGLIRPELFPLVAQGKDAPIIAEVAPAFLVLTQEGRPESARRSLNVGSLTYRERFQLRGPDELKYHHYISLYTLDGK